MALAFFLTLGPGPMRGQDAPLGGIRGRVLDAEFGAPVANVTVSIEGLTVSARTDEEGSFVASNLPPGRYDLTFSREGYATQRVANVVVPPGAFAEKAVEMVGDVVDLDDFVLSAEDLLGDQVPTLDLQKDLIEMANVLGSDFISKIGGADIGKALVKTVGVSVVGGRYVVIRGLADRYNVVLLNGAGIPSSDPDRRAVNIDLFPGSIVQRLVTAKTFTPNLPGESTGGSIDIVTKGLPDQSFGKFKFGLGYDTSATGNPNYLTYQGGGTGLLGTRNDRRLPDFIKSAQLAGTSSGVSNPDPDAAVRSRAGTVLSREMGSRKASPPPAINLEASAGYRGTFFGAPAGLVLSGDYRKDYRWEDDSFEGRYSFDGSGNVLSVNRESNVSRGIESLRASIFAVAGVQPAPGHEIKATVLANVAGDDRTSLRLGPKFNGLEPDPFNTDVRESIAYTERRLRTIQLAGNHLFGEKDDHQLTWVGSYNLSSQDEPDHRFVRSTLDNTRGTYGLDSNLDQLPFRRYWRELTDTRWNVGLDLKTPIFRDAAGEKAVLARVGGAFDHSDRDYRADNFAYRTNDNYAQPNGGLTFGNVLLDEGALPFRSNEPEFYTARQEIAAGFVMVEADITKNFNVVVGFRAEQTDILVTTPYITAVDAEEQQIIYPLIDPTGSFDLDRRQKVLNDLLTIETAQANADIVRRTRVSINRTDVLPSVSFRYGFAKDMAVRAAFSQTIARPSFKELAPVLIRDAESGDSFLGNPDLGLSKITNWDVRWEWFPAGGLVGVSFFSKEIQDAIELSKGAFDQYRNFGDGVVYGMELEADKNLGFLADQLRDFTIGFNYAYIISRIQPDVAGLEQRRLQGQPDYLLNFNLSYENKASGWFAGLYLNVVGAYLDAAATGITIPSLIVEPMTTLNAVLSYKMTEHSKFTLRANNLTSQDMVRYYDTQNRPTYSITEGSPSYSVSVEMDW